MIKTTRYQKGFTVVEGLLIFVIVGVIGGVGWYVVNSKNKTNKTSNQISTPAPQPVSSVTSDINYLAIKEWGIKLKLTETIKNATYNILDNKAWLSTKELDTNAECISYYKGGPGTSFQAIVQYSSTDVAPDESPTASETTVAQNAKQNPGKYVVIGGKYYFFLHGNGAACEAQTTDQYKAFEAAVAGALPL